MKIHKKKKMTRQEPIPSISRKNETIQMTIRLWQQDIPMEANVAMSEESVYIYIQIRKSDHIQNPTINSIPDQKEMASR